MDRREQLVAKIKSQPGWDQFEGPGAVVALEDFFEGNDDLGSIGCNLFNHPGIPFFYKTLREIRSRPDVQEVLVEVSEVDEDCDYWPYSERVYVLTSTNIEEVETWLSPLKADEVNEGWLFGRPDAAPELQPGYHVFSAWWD